MSGTTRVGRGVATATGTFAGVVSFEPAAYVSVPVANSQTRPITAMRGTSAAKLAAIPSASAAEGTELSPYRVNRITPDEPELLLETWAKTGALALAVSPGCGVGASCQRKAVPANRWNHGSSCG